MTYLSLLVVIPLATLFLKSATQGGAHFWSTITDPRVMAAYRVSFGSALLAVKEQAKEGFQIVVPSESILAEPPVSVVDQVVDKHHSREVAEAYLKYLYSPEGQAIAAKHGYRPRTPVSGPDVPAFPKVNLFTVDQLFGGWQKAQKTHFASGGIFDQVHGGSQKPIL